MARLIFPDEGSRLVFRMTGSGKPLLSASAGAATIYVDSAGTTLADIQTLEGVTILSSTLTVTAASQLPLFLGPDGVDTVWCSVDNGPLSPVYARNDDRLDTLENSVDVTGLVRSVNGTLPGLDGNVVIAAGNVVDATSTDKGVLLLTGALGGTATAPTTPTALHTSGAETASGVKTFSDGIVVPDGSVPVTVLPAATQALIGNIQRREYVAGAWQVRGTTSSDIMVLWVKRLSTVPDPAIDATYFKSGVDILLRAT